MAKKVNLRVVGFPVIPDGVRHEEGEEFKAVITEAIQRLIDSGHLAYNDSVSIEVDEGPLVELAPEDDPVDHLLDGENN